MNAPRDVRESRENHVAREPRDMDGSRAGHVILNCLWASRAPRDPTESRESHVIHVERKNRGGAKFNLCEIGLHKYWRVDKSPSFKLLALAPIRSEPQRQRNFCLVPRIVGAR